MSALKRLISQSSRIRLYLGLEPTVPTIESITSDMDGQFNIKLSQTLQNTFQFSICPQNPNDLVKIDPNSTTSLNMVINGLKPKGKYGIRVKATNILGESKWSHYSEYKYPTTLQNDEKED